MFYPVHVFIWAANYMCSLCANELSLSLYFNQLDAKPRDMYPHEIICTGMTDQINQLCPFHLNMAPMKCCDNSLHSGSTVFTIKIVLFSIFFHSSFVFSSPLSLTDLHRDPVRAATCACVRHAPGMRARSTSHLCPDGFLPPGPPHQVDAASYQYTIGSVGVVSWRTVNVSVRYVISQ